MSSRSSQSRGGRIERPVRFSQLLRLRGWAGGDTSHLGQVCYRGGPWEGQEWYVGSHHNSLKLRAWRVPPQGSKI